MIMLMMSMSQIHMMESGAMTIFLTSLFQTQPTRRVPQAQVEKLVKLNWWQSYLDHELQSSRFQNTLNATAAATKRMGLMETWKRSQMFHSVTVGFVLIFIWIGFIVIYAVGFTIKSFGFSWNLICSLSLDFANAEDTVVSCGKDDCCSMLKEYFIK